MTVAGASLVKPAACDVILVRFSSLKRKDAFPAVSLCSMRKAVRVPGIVPRKPLGRRPGPAAGHIRTGAIEVSCSAGLFLNASVTVKRFS